MAEKGLNLFDECAARCALLPEGTVKCTHMANSRRMPTEIIKNGYVTMVKISVEQVIS